jgi:hypothetical protein
VFGPGDGQTVTVTYMSFNRDGSLPSTTATFTGPVFSVVGYACTRASSSADWVLTATASTTGSVGCTLAFGGKIVKTNFGYMESGTPVATSADCTGNPGK